MGKKAAAAMGWTGKEWDALDTLMMKESGWNPGAANPTSSARGVGQTMMSVHFGKNWQNDPRAQAFLKDPNAQIAWTLRYIRDKFKVPSRALQFHLSHNYY